MAIKSVNGKNVYVIDVQVPTPRTSTGQSFGNLVSDLRWDLFDKIQKDIIRSGEIQKLGYQSEYEAYTDLKKSYQDQIANLNELKAKVMTGGSGTSEYLKTLRADAKNRLDYWKLSGGQAGKTETVTYPKSYQAISPFGTVKNLERGYTKTTTYGGAKAPPEGITVLDQAALPDAQAGAAEQAAQLGKATDFIDAEIDRLRQEQAGLVAPSYSGITDYTTAGRKAFAQTMGTGGFGLQNRPSKVQPTFYEQEATAALNKTQADYEDKELSAFKKAKIDQRLAIEKRLQPYKDKLESLQNKSEELKTDADRAEIQRLDNIVSKANLAILQKFVDPVTGALKVTPEEIAKSKQNAMDRMVSDFDLLGSRSVSRAGFLGYGEAPEVSSEARLPRDFNFPERTALNPPGTNREDTYFTGPRGVGAEQVATASTRKPQSVISIEGEGPYSGQDIGALPSQSMLRTARTPSEKVQIPSITTEDYNVAQNEIGPTAADIAAQRMIDAQAAEQNAYGEVDAESARRAAEREAEFRALLGEDYQQMPRPAGARSSFGRMEPSPQATMPIEQRGGEVVPFTRRPAGIADRAALRRLGRDVSEPAQQPATTGAGRQELPDGGFIGSEEDIIINRKDENQPLVPETSSAAGAQTQPIATRQARSDLYLARTIKKGIELANKPAKIERLAKTSLPEKERAKVVPETVALVDKVYDINRGKPNAFKLSFDEISRAFSNKPEQRQQAHEYLVAKDMLEGNKVKPLA